MHDTDRIPVTPGVAQRGFTERSLPDTPVARFGSTAQDRQYIVVIGADGGGIAVEKIEYAVPSAAGLQAPGQFPGNPGSAAGVCGQNSRRHKFTHCGGGRGVSDPEEACQFADGGNAFSGRIFPRGDLFAEELLELRREFFSLKLHTGENSITCYDFNNKLAGKSLFSASFRKILSGSGCSGKTLWYNKWGNREILQWEI